MVKLVLSLAALAAAPCWASSSDLMGPNPIRRVTALLENMQKKIGQEAEKEKSLHEKFLCHVSKTEKELTESISKREKRSPNLGADLKAAEAQKVQLAAEIEKAKKDRVEAEKAIADATALREKEATAFAADLANQQKTADSVEKAVDALQKGVGKSFVQTDSAKEVRHLASTADVDDGTRDEILAFLDNGYAPASGEVIGILKQMGEQMRADIAKSKATEQSAIAGFQNLTAAKASEVKALTNAVESKTQRVGELAVTIVEMKRDLGDGARLLEEDKKFLNDLKADAAKKVAEFDERVKTRNDELAALSDTIKLLTSDDALDIFKKAVDKPKQTAFLEILTGAKPKKAKAKAKAKAAGKPKAKAKAAGKPKTKAAAKLIEAKPKKATAKAKAAGKKKAAAAKAKTASKGKNSFLQVGSGVAAATSVIQNLLKTSSKHLELNLILTALKGADFSKVITMVDNMVKDLKQEQKEEENKKDYCNREIGSGAAKGTDIKRNIADKETAISSSQQKIKAILADIALFKKNLKALDADVAKATEQRKAENAEYLQLVASNKAAQDLLGVAKKRLMKFYGPKEAKLVQVAVHDPAGNVTGVTGPYQKKTEESFNVISMLDKISHDLDLENAEAANQEKNSQKGYEKLLKDSADKRQLDIEALTEKNSFEAAQETSLAQLNDMKTGHTQEFRANTKMLTALHAECDSLLADFDLHKEARESEIEALGRAKATLQGAKLSFIQTGFLAKRA